MSADRYPSVPERITWTTGFRVATDKAILGTLSTFANFRTGKHADMALPTLAERAGFPLRTVERSLQRLIADEWVFARRRHRRPTVYDINVDKLATHWMEAKLVAPIDDRSQSLSATGGGQDAPSADRLSATGDALSAVGGGLTRVLSATGGGPSPVRTDPQFDHKEPALRAEPPDENDQPPPPAGPSDEAKVRTPHQLTFGVMGPDESRAPPQPDPNWRQRFADTLRSALRKHG